MQTIDAHVHFWKYAKSRNEKTIQANSLLRHDYLPENLALNLQRNGVTGCLAVESEAAEVETRFLSELAVTHPVILGVIGWIDITAPDIDEKLEAFSVYPAVRGYRYDLSAGNPTQWVDGIRGLKKYNYSFDLVAAPSREKEILGLVQSLPGQSFILDHCGSPDVRVPVSEQWRRMIKELAQSQDIHCKVSGLLNMAERKSWSPAQFYPFLDTVFEYFGTDRLIFGSDWPFLLLSGLYIQWKSLIEKYMESFASEEKEKVFAGNAARVYRL
jgi:L-fuconolactonase